MISVGIDLASQPKKTGICVLEWDKGSVRITELDVNVTDDRIIEAASSADATGIDAPFGWPDQFVQLVNEHHHGGAHQREMWCDKRRDELRFRATDHFVRSKLGRWPLSVSTELIGVPALRCAGILRDLGVEDRSGACGRVFEVYPAAGLSIWKFLAAGYKGKDHSEILKSLIADVLVELPELQSPEKINGDLCDDEFDAFVAALLARSAWLKKTIQPGEKYIEAATREGWIHLPESPCLHESIWE